MNRIAWSLTFALVAASGLAGCRLRHGIHSPEVPADLYQTVATEIEYPDAESPTADSGAIPAPPVLTSQQEPKEYWNLTLEEAFQLALQNSRVLRDLGGTVLRVPDVVETLYGPALQETNPQSGVEAALSAFDALLAVNTFYEKNDRALNNELLGGGTRLLQQDRFVFQAELSKRTATGTQFAIRKNIDYDANNAPENLFPSAWNANVEAEFRQPLLQGRGIDFNRIAGTGINQAGVRGRSIPGIYNGVLVARVNTDVRLADFEIGVRDLASNVENAYWDLYYAYRDLEAKVAARNAALEIWRRVHALYEAGRRGGEAEKEAQAREQYYRFEEEVQNALGGRLVEGTRTNNGSHGGTFRGNSGVYVAERRLRLVIGIPVSDGKLIRPAQEPSNAKVLYDWYAIAPEAITRRAELRRQKWLVKRRDLELLAARNYLLPRLDTVGRYRWRGFGDDLLDPNSDPANRFDNAYQEITVGDFQEWMLGLELTLPFGFRQGHSAVRNAQLQVARERAILHEQERQVLHDLADAVAELDRAYLVAQTNANRRLAARQQLAAVQAAFDADKAPLDQVLLAQRRVADGDTAYYRSLIEYTLAVRNVHFEKGSLLDYCEVYLAEGPWPGQAYLDAQRLAARRGKPHAINYAFRHPVEVSRGGYIQQDSSAVHYEPGMPDEFILEEGSEPEEVPAASADEATRTNPVRQPLSIHPAAAPDRPHAQATPPGQTAGPTLQAPTARREVVPNPLRSAEQSLDNPDVAADGIVPKTLPTPDVEGIQPPRPAHTAALPLRTPDNPLGLYDPAAAGSAFGTPRSSVYHKQPALRR